MKNYLFLFSFSFLSLFNFSQNFVWVKGDNTAGAISGTYGVQGVANAANNPGHRHGCATWVDSQGNLWLFGGEGYSNVNTISWLGDLWKYSPTTNQWTWIRGSNGPNPAPVYGTQGVPSSSNEPGAREFPISWTDNSGNFWMFGGTNNTSTNRYGDMWKYNPTSNQWTWMHGFATQDNNGVYGTMGVASSLNMPGSRYGAGKAVDPLGNLWMFGGKGFPASGSEAHLNDLWKYNISTNQWTWIGGTNLGAQPGIYGTLGVASATNLPGGVEFPCTWMDATGNFYLFGGRGYASGVLPGRKNDFWKFNPSTGLVTWIGGPNIVNQLSVYSPTGVPTSTGIPGGRFTSAHWKDLSGNFWLFGGEGYGVSTIGQLNDLWKYNPTTNQFTFMKGSTAPFQNGIYGTMGVASPSNMPGAREYNTYWTDPNGVFWLFGAEGYASNNVNLDNMNDLWKYAVPCNPDSISASGASVCVGNSVSLAAYNQYSSSVNWYNSPTGTNVLSSGSVLSIPSLTVISSPTVLTYYAQSNSCTMTPRTSFNVFVNALPSTSFQVNGGNYCAGNIVTVTPSNTAYSYTWNGTATGSTFTTTILTGISTITVNIQDNNNCLNSTSLTYTGIPLPTVGVNGNTNICIGSTTTLTASGANTYTWNGVVAATTITNNPTSNVVYTVVGTGTNGCNGVSTQSVNVFSLPNLSVSATKTSICCDETITISVVGANSYTWNNAVNSNSFVFTTTVYSGTFNFTVTGIDIFGCKSTSTIQIKVNDCFKGTTGCVSINKNFKSNFINLNPNPNSGEFSVSLSEPVDKGFLEIYNLIGEKIYSLDIREINLKINVNISSGIYFYFLRDEKFILSQGKLVIEK